MYIYTYMYTCTYIWTRERETHTCCVQQATRSSCAPAHDAATRQNMFKFDQGNNKKLKNIIPKQYPPNI